MPRSASAPRDAEPEPLGSPADTVIDSVTLSQQDALQTLESARTAMVGGVASVQREIAGFVAERIRRDVETQQALLRCRTVEDLRSVQAEYFRTAMDQYAAEATRLMKLGSAMMAKSLDRGAG